MWVELSGIEWSGVSVCVWRMWIFNLNTNSFSAEIDVFHRVFVFYFSFLAYALTLKDNNKHEQQQQ